LEEARKGLLEILYPEEYYLNFNNDTYNSHTDKKIRAASEDLSDDPHEWARPCDYITYKNIQGVPENMVDQAQEWARLCSQLGLAPNSSFKEVRNNVAALNSLYAADREMQKFIYEINAQISAINIKDYLKNPNRSREPSFLKEY
jgi:hypothetical protein